MSISDGQAVDAATVNPAFVSKTAASQTIAGSLAQADTTQSTDKDTGAIVTEGGLGVEKNINAGGDIGGSNLSGTNTGDVTLGTVGNVPNAEGSSIAGQVLTLQPADGTFAGLMTAVAQTFAGIKTFGAKIIAQAQIAIQREDVATTATIAALSSSKSYVKMTGSTLTDIQGVAAGSDGQTIVINNSASVNVTLKNEDAAAAAADRLAFPGGSDFVLTPLESAELIYDLTALRWVKRSGAAASSFANIGATPNAQGASVAGGVITLQPADTSFGGLVTTATQAFQGRKTFHDRLVARLQFATERQDVPTATTIEPISNGRSFIRLTGSTTTEIRGATSGANGQNLMIYNGSSAIVTLKHEVGATVNSRFNMPGDVDVVLAPDESIDFVYETGQQRWIVKSNPGLLTATNQTIAGAKTFSNTTEAVSKDTGAIIIEGGLGVEKNIHAGGSMFAANLSGTNSGNVITTVVGSSPNNNGASISSQVLTLQPTNGSFPGVLTIIAQTIGGVKTFTNKIIAQAQVTIEREDVATAATIAALSSAKSYVKMTGSTVTDIQGITAGTDGQTIVINNSASVDVTLKDEDAGAAAANRLAFPSGIDIVLIPLESQELIYDLAALRWIKK